MCRSGRGRNFPRRERVNFNEVDVASEGQVTMTKIDERSGFRTARWAASAALMLLVTAFGPCTAGAATTIVQQDHTPILSAPGMGGQILTRVDAGFELTVLGRAGDWLEVTSSQFGTAGPQWVAARRVGTIVTAPGEFAPAPATTTGGPAFRIVGPTAGSTVITTTEAAPAEFRIVQPGARTDRVAATSVETAPTVLQTQVIVPEFRVVQPPGNVTSDRVDVVVTTPAPTRSVAPQSQGRTISTATPSGRGAVVAAPAAAEPAVSARATAGSTSISISVERTTGTLAGTAAQSGGTSTTGTSASALGNPTPAFSGNPTPALGNPTPAFSGNPTGAPGNPTPAIGNTVSGFGGATVRTQ
jgi:hypothetical protein